VTLSQPILLALPWVITPIVTLLRARRSRSLDAEAADVPLDAPLLSIVVPARNEAHNIGRCVASVLASRHPNLELIVVDDHSSDGTGDIVQTIAAADVRVRIVVPDPLPADWFGKQWACAAGAAAARGSVIGFLDADTWQSPDLLPRIVNAMAARGSDLLTVAGTQELGTLWERLLQPQIFAILLARYGGTEVVNESRHVRNKIANGQCLFVRRVAYEAVGGHASVRGKVAEDLALAHRFFEHGYRTTVVLGLAQLSTRMYTSLRELIAGWGKNIYAGGADAMPLGAFGRAVYPLLLLLPSLSGLLPPVLLLLALAGVIGHGWLVWSAIVFAVNLVWWLATYVALGLSPLYALLHPLGAAMLLYISVRAIARGRRVEWKGRGYIAR
jgi:chlorobactene glucosyltransferase